MKTVRRVLAWILIALIVGMVVATLILGIQGSSMTMSMLGATFGVSIITWVIMWFSRIAERNMQKSVDEELTKDDPEPADKNNLKE